MADYKEKIIAYIEGKISPEEFFPYLEENPALFEKVRSVLDKNKAERHIRGGEATKQKYIYLKHL